MTMHSSCTGGAVAMYCSCVVGCSDCAFYLCIGSAVTMHSNCALCNVDTVTILCSTFVLRVSDYAF